MPRRFGILIGAIALTVAACGSGPDAETTAQSASPVSTDDTSAAVAPVTEAPVSTETPAQTDAPVASDAQAETTTTVAATTTLPPDPIEIINVVGLDDFSQVTDAGGGYAMGSTFTSAWVYNPATGDMATKGFEPSTETGGGNPIGPVFYVPGSEQQGLSFQDSAGFVAVGNTDGMKVAEAKTTMHDEPNGSVFGEPGETIDATPDCDEATNANKPGDPQGCPPTNQTGAASFYVSVGSDLTHFANDGTVLAVVPGLGTHRIFSPNRTMVFDSGSLYVLLGETVRSVVNDQPAAEQLIPGAWTITSGAGWFWAEVDFGGHDNRGREAGDGSGGTKIYRLDPSSLEPNGHIEIAAPARVQPIAAGAGSLWAVVSDLNYPTADGEQITVNGVELRRYDAGTLELVHTIDLTAELRARPTDVDFFGNPVSSMVFGDQGGFLVALANGSKLVHFTGN